MTYTEEQLDAMSSKVGSVLGKRLNYLSRGQKASLEHALVGVLEDHNGQVKTSLTKKYGVLGWLWKPFTHQTHWNYQIDTKH